MANLYEDRQQQVVQDGSAGAGGNSNMNSQIYQNQHEYVRASSGSFRPSPASSMSRRPVYGSSLKNMSPVSSSCGDGASFRYVSPSGSGGLPSYVSQVDGTSEYASSTHRSSIYTTPSADLQQQQQPQIAVSGSDLPESKNTDHESYRPQIQSSASTSSTTTHSRSTGAANLRPISEKDISTALQKCLSLQNKAVSEHGKQPFAALLLAPDNTTTLAKHFSVSHFQHAESELVRLVATQYSQQYLARCTLVSTWEPCAMCSGAIYWSGVGRVIYGASESNLSQMMRDHNQENTIMSMNLPCRTVFGSAQRPIEVIGPVSEYEARIVQDSGRYWQATVAVGNTNTNGTQRPLSDNQSPNMSMTNRSITPSVSVYNPQASDYGKIGDDGEYQADLKVDWMF